MGRHSKDQLDILCRDVYTAILSEVEEKTKNVAYCALREEENKMHRNPLIETLWPPEKVDVNSPSLDLCIKDTTKRSFLIGEIQKNLEPKLPKLNEMKLPPPQKERPECLEVEIVSRRVKNLIKTTLDILCELEASPSGGLHDHRALVNVMHCMNLDEAMICKSQSRYRNLLLSLKQSMQHK